MHQKCIRNIRNVFLLRKFRKNPKCIRNTYFSPVHAPSPDQFLNIFCLLYIHPQLLHLILNSHISPPPTHPKTINILKCKWLPTVSLNFFPPRPILKHILSFTHPPPITPPYPQFPHFSTSNLPQSNQFCKMQMVANN